MKWNKNYKLIKSKPILSILSGLLLNQVPITLFEWHQIYFEDMLKSTVWNCEPTELSVTMKNLNFLHGTETQSAS